MRRRRGRAPWGFTTPSPWSWAPRPLGAFGGAQLAAELFGALEAISDDYFLAGFGRAPGPCALGARCQGLRARRIPSPARSPMAKFYTHSASARRSTTKPSHARHYPPGYVEQAPTRGHDARSQSGLGVGCKLCSSSKMLRGREKERLASVPYRVVLVRV